MDLQEKKLKLQELQKKIADAKTNATNSELRAGGFGDELSKSISQNDATYRTLDNDVNSKRNEFYNTSELDLPRLLEESKGDPMLAFQNLGRQRVRRGTSYQNSDDIRNRKKKRVEDLVGEFVRAAALQAQNDRDNVNNQLTDYQLAESDYNRDYTEEQNKIAREDAQAQREYENSLRSAAMSQQTKAEAEANDPKLKTFAFLDEVGGQADQYALSQGLELGSPEFKTARETYLKNTLDSYMSNGGEKAAAYGLDSDMIKNYYSPINSSSSGSSLLLNSSSGLKNVGSTIGALFK